ncbi:MAG: DUF6929 family protein [Cytophagales bacterium]
MEATICKHTFLPDIPSASGIEIVNDQIYVIGDDSNFLYILDRDFSIVNQVNLYEANNKIGQKIAKKHKYDLEAITAFDYENELQILVLGSGSNQKREVGFILKLNFEVIDVSTYISNIYNELGKALLDANVLNIEGLAADENSIYILHRGNISKNNILFEIDKSEFIGYLLNSQMQLPSIKMNAFSLPSINGILAGFSGCCVVPNTKILLFCAAVENTDNEINDGEILGCFVGMIDLSNRLDIKITNIKFEDGFLYKGKLESIAILKSDEKHVYALGVSDMDGGISELVEIEIKL